VYSPVSRYWPVKGLSQTQDRYYKAVKNIEEAFILPHTEATSWRSSPTLIHVHMGNTPSLPGLGGGRTHGMRYPDDPDGSWKGRRPEGIPAENVETQLLERIEEESVGRNSEIEVLEPSVSHNGAQPVGCCQNGQLWKVRPRL